MVEEFAALERQWREQQLTAQEVRREVRRLLFKHHPDRNRSDPRTALERTRVLLDWYRMLSRNEIPWKDTPRPTSPSPAPSTEATEYVLFHAAGGSYGCEVRWVVGVRGLSSLCDTRAPLPRFIRDPHGLFILDGIRHRAGHPFNRDTAQLLLLRVDRASKAYLVDRVAGVSRVEPYQVLMRDGLRTFDHTLSTYTLVSPAFFGL